MNVWMLEYDGFDASAEPLREALCTLGNGYLATRGAAPETVADGTHYPGTYVAGCYNRMTTEIAGRMVTNEDIVNVPNWLTLRFRVGKGRWCSPSTCELLEQRQELDLRRGVLTRHARFRDRAGRTTSLTQRRLVSMSAPHLAALETTFVAEDWSGELTVRSGIDGGVQNTGVARYRELRGDHLGPPEIEVVDDETVALACETKGSRIRIAEAARTRVVNHDPAAPGRVRGRVYRRAGLIAQDLTIAMTEGVPVTVEKVAAISTSRDPAIYEPALAARAWVAHAGSFDALLERHVLAWDRLWRRFDIRIEGSERAQLILRLHIFHLLQTVSENTIGLDVGVPARGLHGEAYRGHIFWDELFILPFLNMHLTALARTLLGYRYRRLQAARWAAEAEGHTGAMYPWQSGSEGREESQTLHLNPRSGRWLEDASHRQRHIGIAIAYNVWFHYEATGDLHFLRFQGAPMVLEIARFFASLATYDRAADRYHIRGVMGPDEYHDGYPDRAERGLDDNAYTNIMTVWVICRALSIIDLLPEHYRDEIRDELGLTREELDRWDDITHKMTVPFHDGRIISQFDGYANLRELDWAGYAERYGDIQRLDRILEAEGDTPNRYKASKQADVLMLLFLLPAEDVVGLLHRLGYPFDAEPDIAANVEYYLRRTSHGSTLSRLVHSWILARLDRERSWEYFQNALESDIADSQGGTTSEGIHLGAMAGTVDMLQRGYTGLAIRDGVLWLDPRLPAELSALEFSIHYRGQRLEISIDRERLRVRSRPGPSAPVRVALVDEIVEVAPGDAREVPLDR